MDRHLFRIFALNLWRIFATFVIVYLLDIVCKLPSYPPANFSRFSIFAVALLSGYKCALEHAMESKGEKFLFWPIMKASG